MFGIIIGFKQLQFVLLYSQHSSLNILGQFYIIPYVFRTGILPDQTFLFILHILFQYKNYLKMSSDSKPHDFNNKNGYNIALPVKECRQMHPFTAWQIKFSFGHSQGSMQ